MSAQLIQDALGLFSGSIVGFSLGLVGGGGSILAVPLLIYLVGVPSAHVAIGTSALAVAANAASNLAAHTRMKTVKWRCAAVFATAGMLGSYGGSSLSKLVDGPKLIGLFAILMLIIAGVMFARRGSPGDPNVRLNRENLPKLLLGGIAIGALSGFFGIGGGFLIVPGLMLAAGMPIMNAVGSSLVAVTAFGATAAANYAISGLVDWRLVVMLLSGGVAGGLVGSRLAHYLGATRGTLNAVFAVVIVVVAVYMLWRTLLS
jgi:uncharacterized membrane protein YfcA